MLLPLPCRGRLEGGKPLPITSSILLGHRLQSQVLEVEAEIGQR